MPEHDALILSYSHLAEFPRAKDALQMLNKVASLVKPIMRARGWKVRELAEFYPDQANLLGLNVNRGQRILIRLRYPGDRTLFLPMEQVVDTMLHELAHVIFGPHDGKFHALWNQLRDEHEALIRKGYTGEGFLSDGHRLGGGRVPMHEARRLARVAAEKRRSLTSGSGQRLGGVGPRPGSDIRQTIVSAVERRNNTLQGCGNTKHNDREIQEISETATRNSFRTQAEEDAANEAAIAQALWELVQEEEKQRYGNYYIPPSAENPTGNGGGMVMGDQGNGRPLIPPPIPGPASRPPPVPSPQTRPPIVSAPASRPAQQRGWTCGICTLHNPASFLCCDACGTERGQDPQRRIWTPNAEKRESQHASTAVTRKGNAKSEMIDLTRSPQRASRSSSASGAPHGHAPPAPEKNLTWQCSLCGTIMERQWWTCSTCGVMKDNSR